MKTVNRMMRILLPAVMAILVCLFWGCLTEEVMEFSGGIGIRDVLGELASCGSQAEAEAAIRNLLNKVEIGTAFPGSRYESYEFSDVDIADLAELHLLYLDGQFRPPLAHTFEAVMQVADYMSMPRMEFYSAASILRGQTAYALVDPEEPGNALLVTIASEDGEVPGTAPSYNESTIRSPVQATFFALWLHREFAGPSSTSSNLAPADGDDDDRKKVCRIKCYVKYIRRVLRCYHRFPPGNGRDECLREAEEKLRECLEDCHDQGEIN
jgi:hypothetical protein